jgi:hypothetical protein
MKRLIPAYSLRGLAASSPALRAHLSGLSWRAARSYGAWRGRDEFGLRIMVYADPCRLAALAAKYRRRDTALERCSPVTMGGTGGPHRFRSRNS